MLVEQAFVESSYHYTVVLFFTSVGHTANILYASLCKACIPTLWFGVHLLQELTEKDNSDMGKL